MGATGRFDGYVADGRPRYTFFSEHADGREMGIAVYGDALAFCGVLVNDA